MPLNSPDTQQRAKEPQENKSSTPIKLSTTHFTQSQAPNYNILDRYLPQRNSSLHQRSSTPTTNRSDISKARYIFNKIT